MTLKLCRATYYPDELPTFQMKVILPQFVFSVVGDTNIYETDNPFEIHYYATERQELIIQNKIDAVMPRIERASKLAVYTEMLLNGVFIGGNDGSLSSVRKLTFPMAS